MIKFGFKIKTRGSMVVDNLQIGARDQAEAERKVSQIYQRCEILECFQTGAGSLRVLQQKQNEALDLESAIDLIDREPDRTPAAKS